MDTDKRCGAGGVEISCTSEAVVGSVISISGRLGFLVDGSSGSSTSGMVSNHKSTATAFLKSRELGRLSPLDSGVDEELSR